MNAMRRHLLMLVPILGLAVAGCPTPTQYGGPIAVDTEGFAARMAWLCRWGVHDGNDQGCFDPKAKGAERAAEQEADAGGPIESDRSERRSATRTVRIEGVDASVAERRGDDAGAMEAQAAAPEASVETPSAEPEPDPYPEEPQEPEPPAPPDGPGEDKERSR